MLDCDSAWTRTPALSPPRYSVSCTHYGAPPPETAFRAVSIHPQKSSNTVGELQQSHFPGSFSKPFTPAIPNLSGTGDRGSYETLASSDLRRGRGAVAGAGGGCRWSFACPPAPAHLPLCRPVPDRPRLGTGPHPRAWGMPSLQHATSGPRNGN